MRRKSMYDPALRLHVGDSVELEGRDKQLYGHVTREPKTGALSVIIQQQGDDDEQHWPPNRICRVVWSFNGPIRCKR